MTVIGNLRQLLTYHGTAVFLDIRSGKLQHGLAASSPLNVFLVLRQGTGCLVHAADGGLRDIRVAPGLVPPPVELHDAPSDSPQVLSLVPAEEGVVGLLSDGLYLCAEPDGSVTLSRQQFGVWERFSLQTSAVTTAVANPGDRDAIMAGPQVNVVLTVDDAYTEAFLVVVLSVVCNTERNIKFHIISTQSDSNLRRISRVFGALGIFYSIKTKADIDVFFAKMSRAREQFTFDAHYFRLFAADIFPEIQRALYLDSDIVVRADLGLLWDTDVDGHILAAVADPSFLGPHDADFRAAYGGSYFNTGVLLVDFSRWRAESVTRQVCEWIAEFLKKDHTGIWRQYWDQSPLNMALRHKWLNLSPTWNFTLRTGPGCAPSYGLTAAEYDLISADPSIFHFLGGEKPWLPEFANLNRFFTEYRRYRNIVQRIDASLAAPTAPQLVSQPGPSSREGIDFAVIANRIFDRLSAKISPVHFVQVGAHDGISMDPIHRFVRQYGWTGVLVEPVPYLFERLCRNYGSMTGLTFENICIGPTEGTAIFYYMKQRDPEPVGWYSQLSSFRRDVILKHKFAIPDIEEYIVEAELPVITLESLLTRTQGRVDALIVSTVGFDAQVIGSIDLARHDPYVVYFQYKHLPADEAADVIGQLKSLGYIVLSDWINVIATKPVFISDAELRDIVSRMSYGTLVAF